MKRRRGLGTQLRDHRKLVASNLKQLRGLVTRLR